MKLFLVLFSFLTFQLNSQDIIFSDLTDMEIGKSGITSTNDGEYIYVANGFSTQEGFTTEVLKYHIASDIWSILIDSTIPKRYASTVVVDNKLYILNGSTPTGQINQEVEVIDLTNNSYSLSTINPTPGRAAGISVWQNKIYSFGGSLPENQNSNKLSVFDPITENWTILSDMPIGLETKGEIVNGILYVFGGYNGSPSNRIDKYDIATDTWSFIGEMPYEISAHATSVIDNKIWLVGDYINQTSLAYFDVTDETFDTTSNNMNARRHAAAEGVNGSLYVIGGNTTSSISSSITSIQVVDNPTSLENTFIESSLKIYPNPTSEDLFFDIEMDEVKIFDLDGKLVRIKNTPCTNINIKHLETGIYILIGSTKGNQFRTKFEKI